MKKFALAFTGLALAGLPALADNTDTKTVTVSGQVVAALELAKVTDMILPRLALPATGENPTTVNLVCGGASNVDGSVSYTENGNPFAHGLTSNTSPNASSQNATIGASTGATGQCAELTVTGESGYYFAVSASATTATTTNNAVISGAACYSGSATPLALGVQLSGTSKTIRCGAMLTATAGTTTAGSFSNGVVTVQVTYD